MTEKNKKAPPPAEIFTLKDYQQMRRFSHEMEKAIKQFKQNHVKAEEWDEAFKELNETGELSAKYKKRIEIQTMPNVREARPVYDDAGNPVLNKNGTVKLEPVTTEEPEIIIRYNDKAQRIFREKANRLGKKYQKIISKVNATQTGTPKKRNSINQTLAIMRALLNTPEAVNAFEKLDAMHIAPMDVMPSNDAILWLLRVTGIKNENQIPEKNPNTNETIRLDVFKDIMTYTRTARSSKVAVKIRHISEFIKHREKYRSILLFVLRKMHKQGYPPAVKISLDEMVELGMYESTKTAKVALLDFIEWQRDVGFSGKISKGQKKISSMKHEATPDDADEMGGIMLGNYYCKNNYVFIDVSINFNTDFLSTYYTHMHKNGHELKGDALMLYFYISALARQKSNLKKIYETGCFAISIESIRVFLNLPSVEEVYKNKGRKYKEEIIIPIETAIFEVEEAIKDTPEAQNLGFTLTTITDYYDTDNYMDFLEGKLEIGMAGEYAKPFIQIAEKSEKKRRQRERAIERAKAKKIAEKQLKSPQK